MAISNKKDAYNVMCWSNAEENKRCKSMKNKANKAVTKAMKEKAVEVLTEW